MANVDAAGGGRHPTKNDEAVIDQQPQPQADDTQVVRDVTDATGGKEVENYVRELAKKTSEVENWDVDDVVERFLRPVGLSHLAQWFVDHKVNGAVLLHLEKPEIKEIGYPADTGYKKGMECRIPIGDRVYLGTLLAIVKKGRSAFDRDKVIWSIKVPEGGIQYYDSCSDMMKYRCCPCCMFHDQYTLSGRGLTIKHKPPKFCCFACGEWATDFNDMRFLKDIDHGEKPLCCCYCPFRQAMMTFGDDEDEGRDKKPKKVVVIRHPLMTETMMSHMRSVWAELRLVDG